MENILGILTSVIWQNFVALEQTMH